MIQHKIVTNIMEEIVWSYLSEIIPQYPDLCKCEVCLADIVALTLNNLEPKYVARDSGALYAKVSELGQQFRTSVFVQLAKAIEKVIAHPRHDGHPSPCVNS